MFPGSVWGAAWRVFSSASTLGPPWTKVTGSLRGKALRGIDDPMTHPSSLESTIEPASYTKNLVQSASYIVCKQL